MSGATTLLPRPRKADSAVPPLPDDKLDRIDGKLTDLRVTIAEGFARVDHTLSDVVRQVTDHEARIRDVERWRWSQVGAGAAGGGGLAVVVVALDHLLRAL